MANRSLASIILAAGKGTRMKSDLPKGLHRVAGLSILEHVARAVRGCGAEKTVLVIGHGGELVQEELGPDFTYVWQHEQKGTGHAALMAQPALDGLHGDVLITPGDTPLLTADALKELLGCHQSAGNSCTLATMEMANPTGYGRIVRWDSGEVERIVEDRDADAKTKQIKEVGVSVYVFDVKVLAENLGSLTANNAQGEFYLTDMISILRAKNLKVGAHLFRDGEPFLGVNDRWELADRGKRLNQRKLKQLALSGVTIIDPESTIVDVDVEVGQDTIIEPMTQILGQSKIGRHCEIGPNTRMMSTTVGDHCEVLMSHVNRAEMGDRSRCGPFANLRPGARLASKVKIGNFVEVKNASLDESASVSHLSYIGDGSVGANTNIGAGTIFCNYDGFRKHRTEVGDDVFVGSNSTLVAPVKIGDGAMIAAGSVITDDVPSSGLGIGRARQEVKEEWAKRWREKKQSEMA